eukprot:10202270-Lingulodinium_polyedra.AAC.1
MGGVTVNTTGFQAYGVSLFQERVCVVLGLERPLKAKVWGGLSGSGGVPEAIRSNIVTTIIITGPFGEA